MEEKRHRGRPSVTEKIAGSSVSHYEYVITEGKKYRSKRSVADAAYALSAAVVLTEAASEIEDLEIICGPDYQCRSVLSQLGRMVRQDGFSKADVVNVAKAAIQGKKDGYSIKEIEQYIRHGRMTGEW